MTSPERTTTFLNSCYVLARIVFRNAPLLCSAAGSNGASVAAENGRNANRSRAKPSAERAERGSDPPTRRSASCAIAPPPTTSTPFTASRGMANVCERAPAASDPRISGGRGCRCESKGTREGEVMSYFSQRSRPFTNAPKQENFLCCVSAKKSTKTAAQTNRRFRILRAPRTFPTKARCFVSHERRGRRACA